MTDMALPTYRRLVIFEEMLARLVEPRRFIQVIAGPRQVGKTTLARQVLEADKENNVMDLRIKKLI